MPEINVGLPSAMLAQYPTNIGWTFGVGRVCTGAHPTKNLKIKIILNFLLIIRES